MNRFYIGQKVVTPKGTYSILRETPEHYVVQYLDGEWKGKYLTIPKVITKEISNRRLEDVKLSKKEMNAFLDLFYEEFKHEFNVVYYYRFTEEPGTEAMFNEIRNEYPPLFRMCLNKYLQNKKEK